MEEKKSRHRVNIDETGRRLKRIWLVENWNGEEEEEEEEGSCQQCWMISAEWPRASCLLRAPLGPQSSSVMCTKKEEEGMMENMVPHVKLFSLNSFYDKYDIFVAPLQITALFSSASMSCPSSEGENQTTSLLAPLSFGNLFGFGPRRRQKKTSTIQTPYGLLNGAHLRHSDWWRYFFFVG